MKWKGRRQSRNVEDRRGQRVQKASFAGAAGGAGVAKMLFGLFSRGSGKTRVLMILALIVGFFLFRGPMLQILGLSSGTPSPRSEHTHTAPNDDMRAYLSTMVADNEEIWPQILGKHDIRYRPAKMIIYSDRTRMPSGYADAKMGPFYLPANETIYIDPTFFDELKQKFGARGDFAEAYVVAHEYGHHIQHLLGRLKELHSKHGRVSKTEYNQHSVRVELQADFLAGVFAHHASRTFQEFLERGDIEEAMRCAEAIGDDRLQQQAQGRVIKDSFTHGTSKQRAYWFNKGYTSGNLQEGEALYSLPYSKL